MSSEHDLDSLSIVEAALRTRWPESRIEPSLERITDLVELLGNPQHAYPVIHVGGTNGKTSTARMIDELIRELGLRTGRFTSPHLESVTERISLDGKALTDEQFARAYDELSPYLDVVDQRHAIRLSFFEVLTALAYLAFADAPVDAAIVEVGMGGSWDATNVAHGKVAVVTPISVDHTEYLGDTVADIAIEKAGIIKPGSFAVLSAQPSSAAEILVSRAVEVGAKLAREGVDFGVRSRAIAVGGQVLALDGVAGSYQDVFLPLHGAHQAQNAAAAVASVEGFLGGGRVSLEPDAVQTAFGRARSPGRLEVLRRAPTIIVDAAHNPAGAGALAAAIENEFSFAALVAVVAVLRDKDAVGILEALEPIVDHVVVTMNSSPRALPLAELMEVASAVLGQDRVYQVAQLPDAVETAVRLAEQQAPTGTGVLITGSVVTAGDARRLLKGRS